MKKILVVESDCPIEGLAGALFKRRECVLMVASSGAEGLTVSESEAPDLILYDGLLTDFSAEEFVQAVHSAECTADTPVIVILDDDASDADTERVLKAGAAAAMVRPTDEIDLNETVCDLMGISLRRHLRTFVKMKVDATMGGSTWFATIGDISLGGVMIETDQKLPLGEFIKLQFFLPGDDEALTVITKIVRDGTQGRYGCQFMDLSHGAREAIHSFISATEVVA